MMMVVPLVAILILDARPYQMAILGGATTAFGLAFGLFAGPWIDMSRRRIVLVITDLGSAAALASVAVAHFLFELHIEHLYAVAFVNGSLGIFNEVATRSYLPSLIGRDRLLEANSKIAASDSVVEQIGFSVGGFIAQLASAIAASVVQTVTFLVSGLLILAIRKPEPVQPKPATHPNIRREVVDGYRFIGSNQTFLVMAVSGASSLVGALFATRVTNRLGVGDTMAMGLFSYGVVSFLIPFAPSDRIWIATIFFVLPQIFGDGLWIMHDINRRSLQQTIIPENYLGRVIGAMKVSEMAVALLGVSIAGVVAETVSLRAALFIGSVLMVIAAVVLLHPAIRTIKTIPELPAAPKAESPDSG